MIILLLTLLNLKQLIDAYTIQGRFGHSAVLVNDSIFFYGGDSSVSGDYNRSAEWTSELSILPVHSAYPLTDPPWKPASGPQDSIGGPFVSSHVAFLGGPNSGNMIIIGGLMPQADRPATDEEPLAYSYDCDLGRWNSFSLPSGNHLNRQGAASTTTENGVTYIWGGKRTALKTSVPSNATRPSLSADIYRFDSNFPANSSVISVKGKQSPPLRYGHTQTLISDKRIVVLGGFDGATGDSISLSDVWVYDIHNSSWNQIQTKLDYDNKPANRSSHSQVLMPDGFSILVYGGYDGYHVYNDVAVLDTRTWTWSVKNTNAAVQGRADHTATLVGTNMIVAFGFTGVSTALTVMSDIEVLDITTWSWTSVYVPSTGYKPSGGNNDKSNGMGGTTPASHSGPGSPSVAIIAGAVTGGIVVFMLILIAFYLLNMQHQRQKEEEAKASDVSSVIISSTSTRQSEQPPALQQHQPQYQQQQQRKKSKEIQEVTFRDPPSSTEPFEYYRQSSSSKKASIKVPHPLQINTTNLPTRSNTVGTKNSSTIPSPWTPRSMTFDSPPVSPISTCSMEENDWMIRRAASTPTHHPMQSIASVSKPDSTFYPVKRAATVTASSNSDTIIIHNHENNTSSSTITSFTTCHNADDEDIMFDRQEFILHSDEVAKIE